MAEQLDNLLPNSDFEVKTGTTSMNLIAVRIKTADRQIFRALLRLGSANLLIRVMGMLQQIVITSFFGLGVVMDAYTIAASLPLLLPPLISAAIEGSVIPIYLRARVRESNRAQATELFSTLLNILLIGSVLLIIILIIFRKQIIFLLAPALSQQSAVLAVGIAPIIFPVLGLMILNSFLECVLNAEGQYGWPAYAGTLVPLTIALFVLMLARSYGIIALCLGALVGQLMQLSVITVRARKAKLVYKPVLNLKNPQVNSVFLIALPSLMAALISQAEPLVDQIFGSYLAPGSISALSYAGKLIGVFSGVLFASLGRAMLPFLSQQASIGDIKAFKSTLRLYVWSIGLITLALTAFMIVGAKPLVQILFQRGAFDANATSRTVTTLIGFVIGLTPMAIGFIVSKAFVAFGKTRTLMYITMFSVIANAVFDYIFARLWQSFGIALATSAVYFCTMIILFVGLNRMIGTLSIFTPPPQLLDFISVKLNMVKRFIKETRFSSLLYISSELRQQMIRWSVIIAVFTIAIFGVLQNWTYTLRIAYGSLVILALLRYRYILLLVWVMVDVFIGSTVSFFNGNNFVSALTVSTVPLMLVMPIKQTFKRAPALIVLLIYVLWVFAGIGISPIGTGPFLTLWTVFLDYVAISVLVINVITTRKHLMGLIYTILLVSVIVAVYGIYGYVTKQNGELDPTSSSLFRIASIFGTIAPTLALFLSLSIPLSLYCILVTRGFLRFVTVIMALILLIALGLTFTRGGYIGVLLSVLTMIFFLPSKKLKTRMLIGISVTGVLVFLIVAFSNFPIFTRFFSQDVTSLNGRTDIWTAVLSHFDPTKLLGNGLNATYVLLANLRVGDFQGVIGTASHNIFLEELYDHGIIGLILFVLVFIIMFFSMLRKMRTVDATHQMLLATSIAILINVLFQSFESNDILNQEISIYFWIIMALPFALCWSVPEQQQIVMTQEDSDEDTQSRVPIVKQRELKPIAVS